MSDDQEPTEDRPESGLPGEEAAVDSGSLGAADKARAFPQTPGVYLMKDSAGRVIYVGKAKNLRARASSYFLKAAADERRTADLVREIADIDYIAAESEVDALLGGSPADQGRAAEVQSGSEGRQDISRIWRSLYARSFPRVEFTARAARARHEALRTVRQCRQFARGDSSAAEDFQVSHVQPRHLRIGREMALVSAMPVGLDRPVHRSLQFADLEGGLSPRHPALANVFGGAQAQAARRDEGRDA